MSKLEDDLKQYADEVYTKRDLKAGIKLISEVVGLVAVGGAVVTALVVWVPGVGVPMSAGTASLLGRYIVTEYTNLDEDKRKQIRAVVKWLKRGVGIIF